MKDKFRSKCFDANVLKGENKHRMARECGIRGEDVPGISKKGEGGSGNDCSVWEALKDGAEWTILEEGYGGRGKEWCAMLVSQGI